MFRRVLLLTMSFVCLLVCSSSAKEGVLLGMPDPAVIAHDNDSFYIFATGKGLPCYHSTDLVEWERAGRVFDAAVPPWSKQAIPETSGIWAPDIVRLNDKFYVYYSVSSFGSQRSVIGVAMNTTLDHTSSDYQWIDLGLVIDSHPGRDDFNAIDPAVFQQADGRAFMVWGSHWGGIKALELDPDTGKPLQDNPVIVPIAARPDHPTHSIEGAYMVRHDGFYYMFVSWDRCCDGAESNYKVMVGRSSNPLGPYVDFDGHPLVEGGGTLVLANNDNWRGPGHNSVLTTPRGSWMVHHTYDTFNLEKQRILQIRPIYWTAAGWPVVGEPLSRSNPMTTQEATVAVDDMVGSWRLSVDYGPQTIVDLLPGGRIANRQAARWSVTGNHVELNVPGIIPAGGEGVCRCIVEPEKNAFIGRDSSGAVIRGKQLCH